MSNYQLDNKHSVLASLRALTPPRQLTFHEAVRLAELQASRLLELTDVAEAPVPDEVVSELPRIQVLRRRIPSSGLSYWNGTVWVIGLNATEPPTRQRFTLFHEYKHIIDHGRTDNLYTGSTTRTGEQQAEQVADYFAGCVLMPRKLLKRAWYGGLQTPALVAQHFDVSERAATVRLAQVGLTEDHQRCTSLTQRDRRGATYYRALSLHWLMTQRQECAA
jgi:Zn-dependent peptidase ImmA (M78 family)